MRTLKGKRVPSVYSHLWKASYAIHLGIPCTRQERVVHDQPCRQAFRDSSEKRCDSPSEMAYNPADCGVRSRRKVSAPRTILAKLLQAGSLSWYFFRNASKAAQLALV